MNAANSSTPHRQGLVPAALSLVLLGLSLWGAWLASRQTEYPPIGDMLSYTTKAEDVWTALRQGKFAGLHGVGGLRRPFGTSLMGYPFGYNADFRAFYWRTVAIPACLCALAGLVAAMAAGSSWRNPTAWLLACLGGMLPMWWAFDPEASGEGITHWGMMDGMQASTTALATALLLFGWRRNAALPTFAGFFLSAFTLLLKPVGVFLIAGQTLAACIFWIWAARQQPPSMWRRFVFGAALGVIWCALIGAWCYFSPYFSEANRESGRQALEQLKALGGDSFLQEFFYQTLPRLCLKGIGLVSMVFFAASALQGRSMARDHKWVGVLLFAALLVLTFLLAALYQGTHFLTARYFLPAMATAWILFSPLFWLLLEQSRAVRVLVLLNAAVLAASVVFPNFARSWHPRTGYPTFLNEEAAPLAEVARSALEKFPSAPDNPVIFTLFGHQNFPISIVGQHLIFTTESRNGVPWTYMPRIWETHFPAIHPHEIASADFLISETDQVGSNSKNHVAAPLHQVHWLLNTPEGNARAPVRSEGGGVVVRQFADPVGFERTLSARLASMGLLDPQEVGPVPVETPLPPPLAKFDSGDELLEAQASWVEEKLRIGLRWRGDRSATRHLRITIALVDANGVAFHWIATSLLPPPALADGRKFQRTIVDKLDCGNFRERTAGIAVGVYDRTAKSMVHAESSSFPDAEHWIPVPIAP